MAANNLQNFSQHFPYFCPVDEYGTCCDVISKCYQPFADVMLTYSQLLLNEIQFICSNLPTRRQRVDKSQA